MRKKSELFIKRCFDLARLGNAVSPNPKVGSVIVYENKIIGEGFTSPYGGNHAEVNAINNVSITNKKYLKLSTIYVSLEPCYHFGKTPPCVDLILKNKIPKVVISCSDPNPKVAGQSVNKLREKGVEVISNVLEMEGKQLISPFLTRLKMKRPYIVLKFAKSQDSLLGKENKQVWITHPNVKRLVHKWRSEIDAILIGTNTALTDDPNLTTRHYFGSSPLRIILDRKLRLPLSLNVFDNSTPTWIVHESEAPPLRMNKTIFQQMDFSKNNFIENLILKLASSNINNLLVEGGGKLLQSFIDKNLWDEARIFSSQKHLMTGIKAPIIKKTPDKTYQIQKDILQIYDNKYHKN